MPRWPVVLAVLCAPGAAGADDCPTIDGDPVARFVATLDDGDPLERVLCAYRDATAGLPAPVPADGEPLSVAPVAGPACPGAAWAARRGRVLAPRRRVVFADTAGALQLVTVDDGVVTIAAIEPAPAWGYGMEAHFRRWVWHERWVIDNRLWVFGEVEVEHAVPSGRFSRTEHHAIVYDPMTDALVVKERLPARDASSRLEHALGTVGRFELVVRYEGERKVIWRREATAWRP